MGLANVVVCIDYRGACLPDPISNISTEMNPIIHPSQSIAQVEKERSVCISKRNIAAKFHYQTKSQAALWLKLHEEYAPQECLFSTYIDAAKFLAAAWPHTNGSLVALGCGGGEKDVAILKTLPADTVFLATDVSEELAIQATQLALKTESNTILDPLVFDLATADNLPEFIDQYVGPNRIYTFFGIIPNFPPKNILPQLRALLRPGDHLLLSANLNPAGMDAILPQYDNQLTRSWLAEFPRNHGAKKGEVHVSIKPDNCLKYISASFLFLEPCVMEADGDCFQFKSGDSLQLFVSYRYTVNSLTKTLRAHGIQIKKSFTSKNAEEGVFICSL